MSKIAVVYHSGYGHTKVIAETFANEIQATLIEVDQEGNIQDSRLGHLWMPQMQSYLVHQLTWAVCLGNLKNLQMHHLSVGLLVHGQTRFLVVLPTVQV